MPYVSLRLNIFIIICICSFFTVKCENKTDVEKQNETLGDLSVELIEQGRTFVHGTLKRFMVIAPAIFFKLGIAFTLLLLVTLVAVNNGFIGFLILVVGLSSVLARLQGSSAAPLVQHVPSVSYGSLHALPQLSHYHQHPWIDRSDSVDAVSKSDRNMGYFGNRQSYDPNSDLRNTGVYYKSYSTDQ